MSRRAAIVVLDGVGIGAAHDAQAYGDVGSDTLGNLAREAGGLALPTLESLGLGTLAPLDGVRADVEPLAARGTMQPASSGKDSTTGHWEIAGLQLERPFPTYPRGFPVDVVESFERLTHRRVIGNV
ncbi:MAG: phosphopentomutase, partial [Gemmatimonadaceae bacterium]